MVGLSRSGRTADGDRLLRRSQSETYLLPSSEDGSNGHWGNCISIRVLDRMRLQDGRTSLSGLGFHFTSYAPHLQSQSSNLEDVSFLCALNFLSMSTRRDNSTFGASTG